MTEFSPIVFSIPKSIEKKEKKKKSVESFFLNL